VGTLHVAPKAHPQHPVFLTRVQREGLEKSDKTEFFRSFENFENNATLLKLEEFQEGYKRDISKFEDNMILMRRTLRIFYKIPTRLS
jgi:hypothetical protein